MKDDRKLDDSEFDELIEVYKNYVEEDVNRRTRRALVLWSFIPILYLCGDLRLNIDKTTKNVEETVRFMGIPVDGITEEKFLLFLFIMVSYFIVKFILYMIKIISIIRTEINICKFFIRFWYMKGRTESSSRKELREEFKGKNISVHESNMPLDSKFERRYHTWLFVHRYHIIGFIDYFLGPIFFPASLGL